MREILAKIKFRLIAFMASSGVCEYTEATRKGDIATATHISLDWGIRTIKNLLVEVHNGFKECLEELRAELKN